MTELKEWNAMEGVKIKNERFRKIYTLSIQRGGYLLSLLKRNSACK
jgi:hypothetical protein